MDVSEFDFNLPPDLIAQQPASDRASARLLFLDRRTGGVAHHVVTELPDLLRAGDLLVVNNSRVFPARLIGHRAPSGGAVECMLVRRRESIDGGQVWEALMHPGQRLKPGASIQFEGEHGLRGVVLERLFHGRRVIRLWTDDGSDIDAAIDRIGHMPLPPYIKRADRAEDRDRYQTVFASERGSVAAPTAGLHFSRSLVTVLAARQIEIAQITLHVGFGTFQPVRVDRVEDHRVEEETYEIEESAAAKINQALDERRRVIAVGTTTTRALETVAAANAGRMAAGRGETALFVHPGFEFRVISGLMTNFHLPRSSLLMLVAAFGGRDHVLAAYRVAVAERYRFYSYGDAMLIA